MDELIHADMEEKAKKKNDGVSDDIVSDDVVSDDGNAEVANDDDIEIVVDENEKNADVADSKKSAKKDDDDEEEKNDKVFGVDKERFKIPGPPKDPASGRKLTSPIPVSNQV